MIALSAWLLACAPDTGAPALDTAAPAARTCTTSIRPGVGEQIYTPARSGDVVPLVHGPQNAYHLDLAGEVSSSSPDLSIEAVVTRLSDGTVITLAQPPLLRSLSGWSEDDCTGTFSGSRTVLDFIGAEGCAQLGESVRVDLKVWPVEHPEDWADTTIELQLADDGWSAELCL